ncbi:IclR family transcriptional regulator [Devosia sp.]|uniref:IclR family transcriptional regulator n=1 Tax=Devosia sp. TaxID=1871048 RepID=UPI00261C24C9|nr:IclR family transcriptional regulator [Devosia sp.]
MNGSGAQGTKSLEAALKVLLHLAGLNGATTLTEIARECGMPPSKVHRYLTTFVSTGLVRQEGRSGQYDIGPAAMQLGLAAIARHDFVNRTADGLGALSLRTGMTALLTVWGNGGATVVRWERGAVPAVTSMGLGTSLPLLNSASGRAFLAWYPRAGLERNLEEELKLARRNPGLLPDAKPTRDGIEGLIQAIRQQGYAHVDGRFMPGLVSAAVPILDWQGEAQAVVSIVGTDPASIAPGSAPMLELEAFGREFSSQRQPVDSPGR